jgi:hypothetical protein
MLPASNKRKLALSRRPGLGARAGNQQLADTLDCLGYQAWARLNGARCIPKPVQQRALSGLPWAAPIRHAAGSDRTAEWNTEAR